MAAKKKVIKEKKTKGVIVECTVSDVEFAVLPRRESPAAAAFNFYSEQIKRSFPEKTSSYYAEQSIAVNECLSILNNKKKKSLSVDEIQMIKKTLTGCSNFIERFTTGGIAALDLLSVIDKAKKAYNPKDPKESMQMLGMRLPKRGQHYPHSQILWDYFMMTGLRNMSGKEAIEFICKKYGIQSEASATKMLQRIRKTIKEHNPSGIDFLISNK